MAGARSAVSQPSPPSSRSASIRADVIDHPPVADQHQPGQPEPVAHHLHDGAERGRAGGVAGKDPDRDRSPGRVGEQPVLDLRQALLAVPGVAAHRQRAVRAFHPGAGQVEVGRPGRVRRRRQVPAGQGGLDRLLAVEQPVHRGVDLVGAHLGQPQVRDHGGVGPPAQRGQLRRRAHHPGQHQAVGDVAGSAGRPEQFGQAQRAGRR
jgi:hypothetical protein